MWVRLARTQASRKMRPWRRAGSVGWGGGGYEFEDDRVEMARALKGTLASSRLFVGHDGVAYKRGYAAIGEAGGGVIAVEGSADYYAALAAFRHRLLVAGGLA